MYYYSPQKIVCPRRNMLLLIYISPLLYLCLKVYISLVTTKTEPFKTCSMFEENAMKYYDVVCVLIVYIHNNQFYSRVFILLFEECQNQPFHCIKEFQEGG